MCDCNEKSYRLHYTFIQLRNLEYNMFCCNYIYTIASRIYLVATVRVINKYSYKNDDDVRTICTNQNGDIGQIQVPI